MTTTCLVIRKEQVSKLATQEGIRTLEPCREKWIKAEVLLKKKKVEMQPVSRHIPAELRASRLEFEISITSSGADIQAEEVTVTIASAGSTFFSERHGREAVASLSDIVGLGTFSWHWDGYGSNQSFDSRKFVDKELEVKVVASSYNVSSVGTCKLKCTARKLKYLKHFHVTIDAVGAKVEMEVGTNFRDTSSSSTDHAALARDGVEVNWSRRDIPTNIGTYRFDVRPVHAPGMKQMTIELDHTGQQRSYNFHIAPFPASFVGSTLFWDTTASDEDNKDVAAHEWGHFILAEIDGESHSIRHKGTSTYLTQETLKNAPTYPPSLQGADVDLMKYHRGSSPVGVYAVQRASQEDVVGLASVLKLYFVRR